ncbi:hypothetical protein THRCLA_02197 [Thraustotheca clavata]|uniref:Uncharacterized protein n=1 Tax=Thraustotheca clavata TaxID=74557 RepID=A0A1W0A6A2_9STRA|nr:hypothetical protein THRCLA_02197 [Thraustotheca clavata]
MLSVKSSLAALAIAAQNEDGVQAWYMMEELVAKYQRRNFYLRALVYKRQLCHQAVCYAFPKAQTVGISSEVQYATKSHEEKVMMQALRDLLAKVHGITILLYDMAELWRDIKSTEVNAMLEHSRMDIVRAADDMEEELISCGTTLHENVIIPLEFKVRKLEELEAFIAVRDQIKLTMDSAERKLKKAKLKPSIKKIQQRTQELKMIFTATDCLKTIFDWLKTMQRELTRTEVDKLVDSVTALFQRSAAIWTEKH